GAHDLTPMAVGDANHRSLRDLGVLLEHALDLDRVDVLPPADDLVATTTDEEDIAVAVDAAEVASSEPPVGVGQEQVRAPGHDLADAVAVSPLDADLDA